MSQNKNMKLCKCGREHYFPAVSTQCHRCDIDAAVAEATSQAELKFDLRRLDDCKTVDELKTFIRHYIIEKERLG